MALGSLRLRPNLDQQYTVTRYGAVQKNLTSTSAVAGSFELPLPFIRLSKQLRLGRSLFDWLGSGSGLNVDF